MQTTQGSTLLSIQNADVFLDQHASELAAIPPAMVLRLRVVIGNITTTMSTQDGHTRASRIATQRQVGRRETLVREHMAPIARVARLELPNSPEVGALRMPTGKPTAERLAATARGMAEAAKQYEAMFVANGLAPDFVQQLITAADDLIATLTDRAQSRGRVKTATVGLQKQLVEGRRVVHLIDAFVRAASKTNPQLYAGWKVVTRVQRSASTSSASVTPQSPAAPASSSPAIVAA